jgi:C1A family cysteine protease
MDYEDNIFRGWTIGEARSFLGLIDMNTELEGVPTIQELEGERVLPAALSWEGSKCQHDVKNQGACGACWAFAVANMLSDRCCLLSSDKGWLSVQELVDCDDKSYGCAGGSLSTPVDYIQKSKGLVKESCLSYKGKKSTRCPDACDNKNPLSSSRVCNCATKANCIGTAGIKSCLSSGPVPIGFSVTQPFMSYKEGIFKCSSKDYVGGHATLATGYSDKPECHYTSQNSWGTQWGEKGYFKIACSTCNISGGPVCTKITG